MHPVIAESHKIPHLGVLDSAVHINWAQQNNHMGSKYVTEAKLWNNSDQLQSSPAVVCHQVTTPIYQLSIPAGTADAVLTGYLSSYHLARVL